eukprot:5721196-Prymnesium_polylepis.1
MAGPRYARPAAPRQCRPGPRLVHACLDCAQKLPTWMLPTVPRPHHAAGGRLLAEQVQGRRGAAVTTLGDRSTRRATCSND